MLEQWTLEEAALFDQIQILAGQASCCAGTRQCPVCLDRSRRIEGSTDKWLEVTSLVLRLRILLALQGDTEGTLCFGEKG